MLISFCGAAGKLRGLLRFLYHTQTHSVALLRTTDQLVAQAAMYTTQPERGNYMCLSGFKHTTPQNKPMQTCTLDWSAMGIGLTTYHSVTASVLTH